MDKWFNKVAIVTGASSGIGKDASIQLVHHGLIVIGCGRNLENLLKVKYEILKDSKGQFIPFQCDITKEEDILKMFDFVKTNYKELSIMINNAGISLEGSILHGKTENWKAIYETNILGLCICTREAFALMKENENNENKTHEVPGHIININSTVGHIVPPNSFSHFYSSSKHAVKAISEAIRQELREAKSNIRITQISPGFVETEFAIRAGGLNRLKELKLAMPIPLQASDISEAIIFALSTEPRSSVHEIMVRPLVQPL